MSHFEYFKKQLRLHALIRRKGTGQPKQCASRLNISRAVFFRMLNDLKQIGAPIEYDQTKRTYYYSKKFFL